MITFERVWAVGRFDVGRILFAGPQQPRAGTVAHRWCFRASPGHTNRQRTKKGDFPSLVETAGYTLASACPKRVLAHTPLLITLVYPLCTREKKELSGWLRGVQGARQTLQSMVWSGFDREHGRCRRRKAVSLFCQYFLGVYPLLSNSLLSNITVLNMEKKSARARPQSTLGRPSVYNLGRVRETCCT